MSSTDSGGGGCVPSAQCDGAGNCTPAIQLYRCCRADGACWTEVIGRPAHEDQAVDDQTPVDTVLRGRLIKGKGVRITKPALINGKPMCQVNDLLVAIDGLPAWLESTWEYYLRKGIGDVVWTFESTITRN